MRMRLLVIWITLTALLQWSRAQEDNIQEVSLSGGVESPEPDEEKPPEKQEDMNKSPGENPTTTAMPLLLQEPGESLTETEKKPQVEEMNKQQSEEDNKEQPAGFGMGTQDMPSDGSQISEMSAEETTGTSSPPPPPPPPPPEEVPETDKEKPTDKEPSSSSEADSHIPKEPPTTPQGAALPDYQNDAPFEYNGPKVQTTPSTPTYSQSCYSCINCNATAKENQLEKINCKPGTGDRSGCFTMIVKDRNLLPGKNNYVERGCWSELSEVFLRYCKDNKEMCQKCEGNYCNVHDMTKLQVAVAAGATSPRLLVSLLIGSICLVSCWRRQVFY